MSKLKSVFQEVRGNFLWDIIKWSILGVLTMVGLIGTAIVQRWRGIPYDVVGIVIVGVVWLLALVLAFVIGRLWKRKSQLPPAAEQVADNEPEAQPINETSHPTPCREKWLHDIADRQKQSINSWLRVFSVEIVQHDLLRKSPFIDFRMSISSYSVWPLFLVSVSGSLIYAARPLEGTLTLRENRITEMQLGNAKSFIVRCSLDPEEAIFILNMGGSFEFSEMRLRVAGTPNFEDVAPKDVVLSHAIQHQEIYKYYPKLQMEIQEVQLKGLWNFASKTEPTGSIVNVKLRFENPRERVVEIERFRLDTNPHVGRTTTAQEGEIFNWPQVNIPRSGERLDNLNDCPIRAEGQQPFEGWLQFILKDVPPQKLNGATPTVIIVATSGEEHRRGTPPLDYS